MHTTLMLLFLLLAACGSFVCMLLLRFAQSSVSRRLIQVTGLFVPTSVLVLLSTLMAHFLVRVCFWSAPPADVALSELLVVVGGVGIGAAVLLNIARAVLLPILLQRRTWDAPISLQAKVRELVATTGLRSHPAVRIAVDRRPRAFVAGFPRPCLVVSTGLLSLLDEEELSAVLYHELVHIQRADVWWTALCGVLRDLTWFLPITRRLYKLMLTEQEVVCDDHVLGEARRVALASALVRVWQCETRGSPIPRGALALLSPEHPSHFDARVRRLLERPGVVENVPVYMTVRTMAAAGGLLALLTIIQVGAASAVMDAMGCGMQLMGH